MTKKKIVKKKVVKRKTVVKKAKIVKKKIKKHVPDAALTPIKANVRLFKVLAPVGNKLTGGNAHHFDWTPFLPGENGAPGPLNRVNMSNRNRLIMCSHGLHVTSNPSHWQGNADNKGHRIFEVEAYGDSVGLKDGKIVEHGYKICVEAVRLIREIKPPKPGQSEYDVVTHAKFQTG